MFRTAVSCAVLALIMTGCGKANKSGDGPVERSWGKMKGLETLVGNMDDTSYSMTRSKSRPNAQDQMVSMPQFEGKFVWAEYVAPWCKACSWQTPVTRKVAQSQSGKVTFLTIMTSRSQKYNDHATVQTAKSWASRYKLDPSRVLAAQLWYKTIPEHRFYSPEGHTLFVHVGALTAEQMEKVMDYYSSGWEKWKKSGQKASWMTP